MPDFLLELFSEEIPARMQAGAAEELLKALLSELGDVRPQGTRTSYGPRRVGVLLETLPAASVGKRVETRGPRVGAPEAAIAGFLRAAGLGSVQQCEVREIDKGSFYFAIKDEPGRPIAALLGAAIPAVLDRFVWPKSMRWGANSARWVRPLHNILAVLFDGDHTEVVPARWSLGGDTEIMVANDRSFGHRFLLPAGFAVTSYAQYCDELERRFVVVDADVRRQWILQDGRKLAADLGCTMKDDPGLLDEVAGLVEWPVVRLGRIEPRFMALPPEVLTTSMRTHQKYFACEKPDGSLAPYFIVVANNEASDGGAQIVRGNERVLRARLSDAEFFWNQDRETRLESRVDRLKERVFHAKLGSVHDKIMRMETLAANLCAFVPGADPDAAKRAVRLAKADLSSSLVGEFPELQGIMGRYLALHDGEPADVAGAIARHYAPAGASDPAPTAPLDIVAALADKIDTLAGFFAIGEPPTGSKDPYALRRAALGVIRTILENGLRIHLRSVFAVALQQLAPKLGAEAVSGEKEAQHLDALMTFLADRLKVALREQGVRHDLVAAVFALGGEDELVRLVARTSALQDFLATEDGVNLLTAYRRASKIVGIEEKKDGTSYRAAPDLAQLEAPEERALAGQLEKLLRDSAGFLESEDFSGAMSLLAQLRPYVDAFFERVTVNVEQAGLRANRLRLLAQIWQALDNVADFSKVEG